MAPLAASNRFSEQFYIFIGSSSEARVLASLITARIKNLSARDPDRLKLEPVPWYVYFDTDEKVINKTFLEVFPSIIEKCEFSLFIVSKDDSLVKRSVYKGAVRDNIWFEAGMFIGKRSTTKTFFFLNNNERNDIHFPTDITGLTLPGVDWDTDIVNLFIKKSKLLGKHKIVLEAVEKKIEDEVNKFCERLIKRIKEEIRKPLISEEAIIITDGSKCFDEGIKLVDKSKIRLYTTVSFSRSLSLPTAQEKLMQSKLEKKIKEKRVSFKRYMNIAVPGIKRQHDEFDKIIRSVVATSGDSILNCINFDYLEMIISDNDVLMVFPNFTGLDKTLHETVAFGFLIKENEKLANILSAWLIAKWK